MSPGVPGGGSVSVVADGSVVGAVAGDECGRAHVGRVVGGSLVSAVLAFGCVDLVSGGSRVGLVGGADGEGVAVVGVVGVDSRVGVLGEYARVGFAVNADSVSGLGDAAWLLDVWLRRGSGDGYGGGVLRVVLSVVARDGSSVVLDDGGVRRVLRGRPVASRWGVESVLGSFGLSFDRRVGEWVAGAGEVASPPSGWDGELTPFVGDVDEWVNGRRANALVVARLVGAGLCAVVAGVPPPLGFSLLRCLVFVVLRVPASSRGVRSGRERGGAAGCFRPRCGSALCVCVSGW